CVANAKGIVAHGSASAVTDNTVDSNATGVALDSGSNANLCTSNVISNSTTVAISDAGTNDIIFENALSGNTANLTATGTGADVIPWRGTLSASGQNYFYPPLIDNQHTSAIENGKARTDVTIGSTSLSNVQTQYNNARSAHPNDVIVLHLTGSSYTGSSSVTLSSDTCILLSGTINLSSGVTAFVASGQSRICISGGTIDGGGNTTAMAVSLSAGCGMVQLDSMTIRNFGPLTPRSSGGVVENSKGATPFIVSRCTLNGGSARGLWVISGPFTVICTDTTTNNFNMDGIDLDSHTIGSLVKFCTCSGNFRCGIFVEQSAYYNQLIGNVLTGNYRCGVSVWNNGLSGAETPGTNWNSVICNDVSSNIAQGSSGYGIETGCQPGGTNQQYTAHNFYFNNDVMDNQGAGIENANLGQGPNGSTQSVENFFCQNIVLNNATDYALSPNGGEKFFNPRVPPLATAAPAFNPNGGTFPGAQSVTITSSTSGASIRYTTDGSTPSETAGTLYAGPVTVGASETLKAIAYASGLADSAVTSADFVIGGSATTITSANGFYNQALSAAQTGTFTATFDASASLSPSNALIGLSQGNAAAYTDIAA
ncbi:MAG TPA: chitobiase/beta-hexosaminidase C-terminal domain-containing protein, partial [Nitrolancea sp.]|nr:chitobiase/beta-hexosaminidase C-terminal domain-containing protein [Nitrolancea sp.]